MAVKHKQGWVWTEGEGFPEGLGRLDRTAEQISVQIERFVQTSPALASEARTIGQDFIASVEPLARLWRARERKYLPLSPEEATTAFNKAQQAGEAWRHFMAREDVQNHIRGVNREVSAKRRVARAAVELNSRDALQELRNPDTKKSIMEHVTKLLMDADMFAHVARGVGKFDGNVNLPMFRRLITVHFVRFLYGRSERRQQMLLSFLQRVPAPSMQEVVSEAVIIFLAYPDKPHLLAPPNPMDKLARYVAAAGEGWIALVAQLVAEGKTSGDIELEFFHIQGFDYSLEAHPEE